MQVEDVWLQRLAQRLRQWRLQRNETQTVAAKRLGISLSTCRRMEGGSPAIPITAWLRAIELYGGGLEQLGPLLRERGSRFEAVERERRQRRRASSSPVRTARSRHGRAPGDNP